METMNERRAKVAAMTHAEIAAIGKMQIRADERPKCPFCGIEMFRTIHPYPTNQVVWECNGYLKNEGTAWWANDQPCGVVVSLGGEIMSFGFGKEYLV